MIPNETDVTVAKIEYDGGGRSNRDIAQTIVDEWEYSKKRQDMFEADAYYSMDIGRMTIGRKSRGYKDSDGVMQNNDTLENNRIASGFVRSNVDQKVNYAVGKDFTLSVDAKVDEKGDNAADVDADLETYEREWNQWLTPEVRSIITENVRDGISKGIGWDFVTIVDNVLTLQDIEPENIFPEWKDRAHRELDALVYYYKIIHYPGGNKTEIKKAEYHDATGCTIFNADGALEEEGQAAHLGMNALDENGNPKVDDEGRNIVNGVEWGKVPFIWLKGTADEMPMLNIIRSQTDGYDKLASKVLDGLLDDIDPVLVVSNIDPEYEELIRTRNMIKEARILVVDTMNDEKGDAKYIQVNPDVTAATEMLKELRSQINRSGSYVDGKEALEGSNLSGEALKMRYQPIDIYTNGLEAEFRTFFNNLKYFFDRWLEMRGKGTVEKWEKYRVSVTFNRDMMVNETELISNTVSLSATGVSQQTIDEYNPAVISHDIEEKRREAEAGDDGTKKMREYLELTAQSKQSGNDEDEGQEVE